MDKRAVEDYIRLKKGQQPKHHLLKRPKTKKSGFHARRRLRKRLAIRIMVSRSPLRFARDYKSLGRKLMLA